MWCALRQRRMLSFLYLQSEYFYCVFGVSAQPGLDTDSLKKLDTWAHTEGGCFSNVPVLQVRIAFLIWTVCSH